MTGTVNYTIRQGETFSPSLQYLQPVRTTKAITSVTQSGQARVTATAHGLVEDTKVWIVGVVGMTQLNHQSRDLRSWGRAYDAYVIDANTLQLNRDTTRYQAYESGGEVVYNLPVDLTGYTARMQIRDTVNSTTVLEELTTENGGITITAATGKIELLLDATETAAIDWFEGVYDLELIAAGGEVDRIISGTVVVSDEVTR